MITFKEFLKQKKIYADDEFAKVYNDDMEAIDPDLDDSKAEIYDTDTDAENENDMNDFETSDDLDVDEDGGDGGASSNAVSIAPSVSAPDSTGGTTSADIAQVPYGLNRNSKTEPNNAGNPEMSNLIKRLDSYL